MTPRGKHVCVDLDIHVPIKNCASLCFSRCFLPESQELFNVIMDVCHVTHLI